LVAALRESKAVGTFFDVGRTALAGPELVEAQRSVGQVVNHSYSHARLSQVSQARRLQEVQTAAKVLGYSNALFLPPFGESDQEVVADVRRTGLTPVYWTVDAQDRRLSPEAIVERALRVRPGGIVRMHDGVETPSRRSPPSSPPSRSGGCARDSSRPPARGRDARRRAVPREAVKP
jgi:peptidoglycan/xylan/chitin deacetylase (PgdA/CDA1 family)